jgi:SAM-dependent methyltransferase
VRLRLTREEDLSDRFPPVDAPFTPQYAERRAEVLQEAFGRPDLLARFAGGSRLPHGYGASLDERVVEYPWLLGAGIGGRMLDAGSTLNLPDVLDAVLPRVDTLTIATLAPEPASFPERGVSYTYADLRELPFRDGWFDTVACLSTLEHVGMDNGFYGVQAPRAADPDAELLRAVAELRRVLRPGGLLLVSVPFGAPEDHGWFRQLDAAGLDRLARALGARRRDVTVFAYDASGWQPSSPRAAAGARYRDAHHDPEPAADLAAAARAVACIRVGGSR